jgi:hypothetical protein
MHGIHAIAVASSFHNVRFSFNHGTLARGFYNKLTVHSVQHAKCYLSQILNVQPTAQLSKFMASRWDSYADASLPTLTLSQLGIVVFCGPSYHAVPQ